MSGVYPIPTGVLNLALVFGVIFSTMGLNVCTVDAFDADATTAENAWCIETSESGGPPNCAFHNFLSCAVAAIGVGGSCKAGSFVPADPVNASNHRAPDSPRRSAKSNIPHQADVSPLSAVDREKLFREFVDWNRRRSNQTDIASQFVR